jgi:predicted amidohydrolase YtcJ
MAARSAPGLAIVDCRARTLDPQRPSASAVAMRDGVILAVGDTPEVRAICDARTEILDGRGMVLTPGLIDLHQHTIYALPFLRGADLTGVRSLDELRTAMTAERLRTEADHWVLGWGLRYDVFGRHRISNNALEEAAEGAPALIRMYDGHASLATRRAIELAGVTERTEFPDGSKVIFEDAVPTGEIREMAAVSFLTAAAPPLTDAERRGTMVDLLRRFNVAGLTCVHLMCDRGDPVRLARDLEESGLLTARLVIPVWARPGENGEQREAQLATRDECGRLWRRGVVKFFADGVIDNGTAWLLEPDARGQNQEPVWSNRAEYAASVSLFADAGFQCATHAVGDGAARDVLDAYRRAGARPGIQHRIEHLETLPDEQVPRFASEGVIASLQPSHMFALLDDGSDPWTSRVGPERAARGWRCRDLLTSGALVTLSSDFPVADFDPRTGMAWARLRREPRTSRPPLVPEQCLDGLQALEGYTSSAARALGEQEVAGRLAVGYRADVTAWDADPVLCSADELVDLPVRLTVVGGQVVHRA